MDGFNDLRGELQALGVSVVAASADPEDKAKVIGDGKWFPVAHGVTRAQADALGAWWEDRRAIIQPAEFMLDGTGTVLASSYSDGPLGRMLGADVVSLVAFFQARKAQG
ncbi:MAG: redoxin domain-containing protein [Alphaproteobacteria bacterium]|nr:redoxin domain-containing protein [Alphaproteobacteria bacterium]